MKVGLFFGSFNPIHRGHIAIAKYMLRNSDLEEIWFVVSPLNPLKREELLAGERHRLKMVEIAIKGEKGLKVLDTEFRLPKPSYTINTLNYFLKENPEKKFCLIIGEDNLHSLTRWKEYEKILTLAEIYVYPRSNSGSAIPIAHPNIKIIQGPLHPHSATMIRKGIRKNTRMDKMLLKEVKDYIVEHELYSSR